MSHLHVTSTARVPASADAVYRLIADYHAGHPRILPAQYFHDLRVESGGLGAGTVIRFGMRVGGMDRQYHMVVAEPEPGRVLVEREAEPTAARAATTFTVIPAGDGRACDVTIATNLETRAGVAGALERWLTPPTLRRVYQAELRQLAAAAAQDAARA
jgi:hypothetical protein